MAAAWLVVVLLLVPAVAASQVRTTPPSSTVEDPVVINPRLAPSSTIPSAPELSPEFRLLPSAPGARPTRTFELRPSVSLSGEYTDNFNHSSDDPISNFRSRLSPALLVLLDTGPITGQAYYRPSVFHDSSSQEFGTQHGLGAQLAWQATSRLRLTLTETFLKSDEPELADRLDINAGRRDFTRNLLALGGVYSIGTIETRAHYRLSLFDSDAQRTIAHAVGGSGSVPIGQIHLLTVGVEYIDSETTRGTSGSAISLPQNDTKTTGYEFTGSFSRDISADLVAGVTAGYAVREQTTATATNDFSRWNVAVFNTYVIPGLITMRGSIGVAQRIGGSSGNKLLPTSNSRLTYFLGPAVLGLTIEKGFSESFTQGENFGVVETQAVLGTATYHFSPLLSAFIRLSYRENEFTGEGGGQAGRKDETMSGSLGMSYQVLQWLTATLDYVYRKTTSSDTGGGFTENRVRAALNASF